MQSISKLVPHPFPIKNNEIEYWLWILDHLHPKDYLYTSIKELYDEPESRMSYTIETDKEFLFAKVIDELTRHFSFSQLRFIFLVREPSGKIIKVSPNPEIYTLEDEANLCNVEIFDTTIRNEVAHFANIESFEYWLESKARCVWVEQKKDAINPPHYQDYCNGMQWLETMQYLPNFKDPEKFKAAVELQIRKYLDRNGRKDEELQELKKARWYLDFLIQYIENGNKPIRLDQI